MPSMRTIFESMHEHGVPPDIITYNTAIAICGDNKCPEDAMQLYDEALALGLAPDNYTLAAVFTALREGPTLRNVAQNLFDSTIRPHISGRTTTAATRPPNLHVYNAAMYTMGCVFGDVQTAEELMEFLLAPRSGVRVERMTLNIGMNAYAQAGDVNSAVHVLTKVFPRQKLRPTNREFNVALRACSAARDAEMAVKLVQSMRRNGIPLNAITFSTAIITCGKAQRADLAIDLYNDMRQKDNVKPNGHVYRATIRTLTQAGKPDHAELILREALQDDNPQAVGMVEYNRLLHGYEVNGQWADAQRIMGEMRGIAPGIRGAAEASGAKIGSGSARGDCGGGNSGTGLQEFRYRALSLLQRVDGRAAEEDEEDEVAEASTSAVGNKTATAAATVSAVEYEAEMRRTLNAAVVACTKSGQWHTALTLIDEIRGAWQIEVRVGVCR